jgi:hypothetical protein
MSKKRFWPVFSEIRRFKKSMYIYIYEYEQIRVIGEGSYGCVHKPPLLCEGKKTSDPSTVTKLMVKTEADKELKEYETMMKIDPKNKFYLGKPTSWI